MPKIKENGGDCPRGESYLLGKLWMKPGMYLPKPQIPRCLLDGVVLQNMKSGSKAEHKGHFSNSDLSLHDNGFANMSDPTPPEEWSDGSDPSKVLPSDVKNCIKQLIASYPDGLQLEKLNHTYWQMYGKRLMPFEYGFKDVVDMVHSLAGDVWVEEGGQGQVFLKVNRGEGDAPLQDGAPSRVPIAVRETFKTILKMNHGVCLLDDLLREYEVRTGSRINLIELSFTSVFDLIANLSDIMGMWRLGSGQFILYDLDNPPQSVSNIPESALTDSESPEHQRRNLCGETIDRLRRLVEVEYPGGLAIEELVGAYRGLFGATLRDLDHEAYGYLSLEALLRSHPEVVTVQTWGGAIRVMRDQSFIPPEERLQEADTKEMPASRPQIPAEAVKPGSLYKCPDVKALMPAGEMVEVVVGEVYSPHRFWMIRRGADTMQALDALMDRMFEFYGSPIGGRYMVPNDFVTIGFPVVALYATDLNFYRAIVTNLEDLTTVRLFFVDYGTICRCDYSSLRLLHRSFLELPAQAIKASLCDVSPPGASRLWPRAASQRFLEMIQNKAFVAQIMVSEKTTSVRLWDTNGEEDINIGQTLIHEGFAVPQNLNTEEALGANRSPSNLNIPSSQLHADLGPSVNSERDSKQSEASRSMSAYKFISCADDLPRVEKLDSGSSVAGIPVMNSSFAASGKDINLTEGLSNVSHPVIPDASSAATNGIIVGLLQRMNELQNEVNALKLKSIVDAQMGNHMRPSLVGPILGPLVARPHTQLGDSTRSLSQSIHENPSLGVDVHRFNEAAQGFAFPTVSAPISTLPRGPPPGFAPLPFCHSTPRPAVYTEDVTAPPPESSKPTEIFYSDEEDGVPESPPAQEEAECHVLPVCFKGTHTLHLVFAGGEAHLLSGEISRLLWNANILETLLQEKGIVLPSLKMTIASHQDTYLRLVECGTDAVYDDVTGKLQKTLTAFPLHVLPWILSYFAHDDQQLLVWAEVLCDRYGNVDREQGEGRELQGQDEQGAGEERGEAEAKGNEHRDEGAEEPQVALDIQRREPAVGPGELRLEWNEQREELAEEPEREFSLNKPTAMGAEAENSLQSNVDVVSAKTELEVSPLEFREIPSPVSMGTKACTAGGTVEVLPARDSELGSEASQVELMEVPFLVAKREKASTAKGTKKEESLKPDRAVLPASDSETGSETKLELRGIPSLVPMGAKACTAEEAKSEKSLNPNTDVLPANDGETTSEGTLELREIPSPVPVGTNPCTTEGTKKEKTLNPSKDVLSAKTSKTRSEGKLELREIPSPATVGTNACTSEGTKTLTSPELYACIPQASESEAGSEERLLKFRAIPSPVLREAKLQTNVFAEWHDGNSRPRLEGVPNTEIQDTKQDPEPKIQDKQDRTSEQKLWNNTQKQKIQDKTEDTVIQNSEIEQTVHMVMKTDLIREGVLKESELQDVKEKLQEMVKYDTQYQKFIGIVERLQLDLPFQSKSKGIIQRLIKLVKMTWEQTHPEGKGKDSDDGDDEEREMSLGFVLQSLRNKSRNSSLDSCKSAVAYQEVQLQEERQHDRENESLPTLEACASELAEVEHTNSEMQEEFSNQLKFTKDLPSNQYPKLPLENYPGQMFPGHCNGTVHVNTVSGKMTLDVREKKHENSTALAATQETAQENRTHKRALSRGRGKFNLCSVRRPGFDYREDPTGARQKKVFFRGRPSQEDLSIFEERDASSSTLSRVNSSRIVSEGGKHLLPSPDIPTGTRSSSAPSVGGVPSLTHA